MRIRSAVMLVGVTLVAAAAALGQTASTRQAGPFHIAILPENPSVAQGNQEPLIAIRASIRAPLQGPGFPVTWTSSSQTVATVNSFGLVSTIQQGTTTITATSGPYHASITLTVTPVALNSITITPQDPTIATNGTQQFTATGNYSDGTTPSITASATWSTMTSAVATVSNTAGSQGKATAVGAGSTIITAAVNGMSASTGLNVGLTSIALTPAPATTRVGRHVSFTATGTFSSGPSQNVTGTVLWGSGSPFVATISPSGLAAGVAQGTSTISAASAGVPTASTMLTVNPAPTLFSMAVTPTAPNVPLGRNQQFMGTGIYTDGSKQDLTHSALWTSSNTDVATVNSSGLASTVAMGASNTSNITALFGSLSGAAVLTVTAPVTLLTITVAPGTATVPNEGQQQFTATGHYSDSSTQDLTHQVQWSSSNVAVAVIDINGLASATGGGTTTIQAYLSTVIGSATLNVPLAPRFAYVGNASDGTVSIYTVDAVTGRLRHHGYLAFATTNPVALTVHPSNKFLYVVNGNNAVSSYVIDPNSGALAPTNPPSATAGSSAYAVTIDPTGKFAYVANFQGNNVSGYTINASTGVLTPTNPPTFNAGIPQSLAIEPTGRFIYIVTNGGVVQYNIDSVTGVLTNPVPVTLSNALSVAIDPTGKFAYVGVTSTPGTIASYTIDPTTGNLTPTSPPTVSLASTSYPLALTVEPSGKFLYAADRNTGQVWGFSINSSSGVLTPTTPGTFAAGSQPRSIAVDPSGRFVSVANQASNDVSAYVINPSTGALTALPNVRARQAPGSIAIANGPTPLTYKSKFVYAPMFTIGAVAGYSIAPSNGALVSIPGSPFAAVSAAYSISFEPSGRFAYVPGNGNTSTSIQGFSVNFQTGVLTPLPNSPYTTGTRPALAVADPSGRFLYVSNQGDNTVSAFQINQATGDLTAIAGSPYPLAGGNCPQAETVDPTGKFLYITNCNSGNLSGFLINPLNGTLTALTGSPFITGSNPADVKFDPTGKYLYVTNFLSDTIQFFSVDSISGFPTNLPGSPFAAGSSPWGEAMDPNGRFLYTANFSLTAGNPNITGYSINPSTAGLTPIASATQMAGKPQSVVEDASGSFLYGLDNLSGNIYAFSIDSGGGLAAVPGSPFSQSGSSADWINVYNVLSPPAPRLASLAITPANQTIAQGVQQQFIATGTFSDGSTQDVSSAVIWQSSNPMIVGVSSGGLALGRTQGSAIISASASGISGSTTLTISGLALSSITVTPAAPVIPNGNSLQFVATGNFSDGSSEDLSQSVIWNSGTASVATISTTGLASAANPGTTAITASSGVISSAPVTLTVSTPATLNSISVSPPNATIGVGSSQQFTATGTYTPGNTTQDITNSATWNSSAPSVASINSSSGLAASAASVPPGGASTMITASFSGKTSPAATLTVNPPALVSIAISPPFSLLSLGRTRQYTATGTFSDGSHQDITNNVTWTSSNANVASINSTGLATAINFGTVSIHAALNGVSGSASLSVGF